MSGERKAVCIIAWPAAQSRSPLIHNYWIKQHGLNAEYRKEAVAPEQFREFVKSKSMQFAKIIADANVKLEQ